MVAFQAKRCLCDLKHHRIKKANLTIVAQAFLPIVQRRHLATTELAPPFKRDINCVGQEAFIGRQGACWRLFLRGAEQVKSNGAHVMVGETAEIAVHPAP